MRISDWSSDVCSADLRFGTGHLRFHDACLLLELASFDHSSGCEPAALLRPDGKAAGSNQPSPMPSAGSGAAPARTLSSMRWPTSARSEEHTSELQSLMRISYAVFCLKKKNK